MMVRKTQKPTMHVCSDPAHKEGVRINELLQTHATKDILLLFSGGSACAILPHIDNVLLTPKVTISVLDERHTQDKAQQNIAIIRAWLHENTLHVDDTQRDKLSRHADWEKYCVQYVPLIDPTPHEGEDVADCGFRFNMALKAWHVTHQHGVVIATCGIGEDGHIAGILPMPQNPHMFSALFETKGLCAVGYKHSATANAHKKRITTTLFYAQQHIHHAIVYATGEAKKNALRNALCTHPHHCTTPASVLQHMRNVDVYTNIMV